ncbi:MAG: CbtA family protein [Bermanella sp.]
MIFRNLVFAAVVVGIISGVVLAAVQQIAVTPTILAAEQFEVAEAAATTNNGHSHASDHHGTTHNGTTHHDNDLVVDSAAAQHTGHSHDPDAWAPKDGGERLFFTAFSNVLAGIGFGLLILAAMTYHGKANMKMGALWGVAGYLTFFVAPALGLHPEIPGMEAANLQGRQGWWLTTITLTALGLGLIAFAHISLKLAGVVLMAIPHVLGAPLPELTAGSSHFSHPDPQALLALEALAADFLQATAIANAAFWVVLGLSCGYFINKFGILQTAKN